jgi:hypothetical protein
MATAIMEALSRIAGQRQRLWVNRILAVGGSTESRRLRIRFGDVGFEDGAMVVRKGHCEESVRVADEFVDITLSRHFLHYSFLVVVT